MLSSSCEKIAALCFLHKRVVNDHIFWRCFAASSGFVTEHSEILKSENISCNMEMKRQAVMKRYLRPIFSTSMKNNCIAVKLYLMRDLGIDPVLLSELSNDSPEVYQCDVNDIESWVQLLLQHSFDRKQITQLIQKYPWLYVIPVQKIAKTFFDLLQEIQITRLELSELCCNAPCVLADDTEVTLQKHFYLHFIMSHRDLTEVVSSGIFNFSLHHIKLRHQFLYRRGQYFKYTRSGATKFQNSGLKKMFCTCDKSFCEEVAGCDMQEYMMFQRLFKIETRCEEKAAANLDANDESSETEHNVDLDSSFEKCSLADELAKHL